MDEKQLSKRLERAASYVTKGDRLADIGSDHAYLPCALVAEGTIDFAIAGEVVEGPYQSAVTQVNRLGFQKQIDVRLGDGLEVINPAEDQITAVTVCGMGGVLIAAILERGFTNHQLTGEERLILQPNVGEAALRRWLVEHHYRVLSEELVEENNKIYEIMVAEKTESEDIQATEADIKYGFYLKEEKSPVFQKKMQSELAKRQRILENLKKASGEQSEKIAALKEEMKEIKEFIQ